MGHSGPAVVSDQDCSLDPDAQPVEKRFVKIPEKGKKKQQQQPGLEKNHPGDVSRKLPEAHDREYRDEGHENGPDHLLGLFPERGSPGI